MGGKEWQFVEEGGGGEVGRGGRAGGFDIAD